jgi:hypothetical protein
MMVGSNLKDQQLQQIVDKTIMEADLDRDGKINFEEFTKMVENTDVSMSMTLGKLDPVQMMWVCACPTVLMSSRSILVWQLRVMASEITHITAVIYHRLYPTSGLRGRSRAVLSRGTP